VRVHTTQVGSHKVLSDDDGIGLAGTRGDEDLTGDGVELICCDSWQRSFSCVG
jgi:hypothetical protein